MTRIWAAAAAIGAILPFAAAAYPEGAPWPERPASAGASCASCHYDSPAVDASPAIEVEGLDDVRAGQSYDVRLQFTPPSGEVAGFLAFFERENEDVGELAQAGEAEVNGAAIRSVKVEELAGKPAVWTFRWTAPASAGPVAMHIAANAANDDASPFGDDVHYRVLTVEVR